MRRRVVVGVVLMAVLLAHGAARAASPTEQLRSFFTAATRILHDPRPDTGPEERLHAVRVLVRDMFDFREAARLSLGPAWGSRTPAERTEFVGLFADLLERSFISGIAARIRVADGVRVSFLDESVDGAVATVRTAIESKSGIDLPFSYRMIERGNRWAVRDVVIDGMSLAANYRAQFLRVMHASSYPELIRQMRERASGRAPLPAASADEGQPGNPSPPAPPASDVTAGASIEVVPGPPLAALVSDVGQGRDVQVRPRPAPEPLPKVASIAPAPIEASPIGSGRTPRDPSREDGPSVAPPPSGTGGQLASVRPAAPRPTGTRTTGARSYWVQVGAFTNLDTARRLALLLQREDPPASPTRWVVVVEPAPSGAPLARVRTGPFAARADAASKLHEVQARGYKPFIAEARD